MSRQPREIDVRRQRNLTARDHTEAYRKRFMLVIFETSRRSTASDNLADDAGSDERYHE